MKNKEKITFEEAMKTFIPEYVECIEETNYNFYGKLGTIYKVSNWIYSTNDCMLEGTTSGSTDRKRFKPSTKEAYDAQFVVKKPEFVLPEKWCIKSNISNYKFIKKWAGYDWWNNEFNRFITCNKTWSFYKNVDYTEITFEQFKKYVLKEKIIEEVIEPLPQFKVIETIETITKVENNEGNQFFIGDIVRSNLGHFCTITGFEYNFDKSGILATTTLNIKFNIDRIEHHVESKVEFILPEKWGILRTNENDKIITDYINKQYNYNHVYLFDNKINPYLHNITGCSSNRNLFKDYVEITFDQFKKYVLKKEQLIIIAESHKGS